ncbi:MAG: maleylacetoacetate isomerase [Xanthomonadaceae bacterium]|nr:maleylacetoacetate isomerase [Xanthomonadaceae bacterium]
MKLYSYWRSSAAYRARIALNLKGLPYELVPVNIAPGGSEQHTPGYHAVNPQRMVPVLVDGERVIRQSLAIVEYLDESHSGARLLPVTARERARARSLALVVACDIHPLNNTRVLQWLEAEFNTPQVERERWVRHWIETGLEALEELLAGNPSTGAFCEGDSPSIADICLAPQCYNAQRFMVDLSRYPTVKRIYEQCLTVPAFDRARPENQPDAPRG